jgi:hypothetical protein
MQRDSVIIYVSGKSDRFGTHAVSSFVFGQEYMARGYKVIKVDLQDTSRVSESVELCESGRVAFAHCEQGRGIALKTKDRKRNKSHNIYESLDIPAITHLRDYPFCPWVRNKFIATSPAVTVFHIDKMAPALGRLMGSSARHKFLPHAYLDWQYDPDECAEREKQTEVLWVGGYHDPQTYRDLYARVFSSRLDLFDACVEACIDNYHTPIWETVAQVYQGFSMPFALRDQSSQNQVFLVNQFVRHERRRRLFLVLSRRKEAVIVWAGPVPELHRRPEATVLTKTRIDATLNMINKTRTMVMCLNNFSHGLSERMLSAMHRRCCVISSTNSLIETTFKHRDNILLLNTDLGNLDECLELAGDKRIRDQIVESAYKTIVPAYSVSHHVDVIFRECGIADLSAE